MDRTDQLINSLNLKNNEAVLLHSEPNMYYVSGYRGEGIVFVSKDVKAIITDFRYTEQAEKDAKDFSVYMIEKGISHNDIALDLANKNGIDKVYVEKNYLSYNEVIALSKKLQNIEVLDIGNNITSLRELKDKEEISYISHACDITVESFKEILQFIKKDVTERELSARLEYIMQSKGSEGLAFSTICAAGKNGSLPHAVPGDYKVQEHDMITFDFGAKYKGYCADMTRTVSLNTPSDAMLNVYNTVLEAQIMAKEALKPGVKCSFVDSIARNHINSKGYEGKFGHGLGHAVGIDIHENPRLSPMCDDIVKVNHILTVEPGIYIPGLGGVRIEDTCLVTENGNKPLTEISRELIIL